VLAGFFLIHLFEHTIAPHFHFGEETHEEEFSRRHARRAVLLGLAIHAFLMAWRLRRVFWFRHGSEP